MMEDLDSVISRLGGYGRWQMYIYTLWCLYSMSTDCFQEIVYNFTGGVPEHYCRLPENLTSTVTRVGQCNLYFNETGEETSCIYGMEYPDKSFGTTVVSEWDLVCENNFYAELSQAMYTLGCMVGLLAISPLSDMFGRKKIHLVGQILVAIFSTASALAPSFVAFALLRALIGVVSPAAIMTGIIASCEVFAAKQRTFAGQFIYFWWTFFMVVLGGLAYAMPNWRHLMLCLSLLPLLSLSGIWLVPESIPWLVANDKTEEAEKILKAAAKMNRVDIPDHPLADVTQRFGVTEAAINGQGDVVYENGHGHANIVSEDTDRVSIKENGEEKNKGSKGRLDFRRVFRRRKQQKGTTAKTEERENLITACRKHKIVLKNLIVLSYIWFVNGLVYYGMALSATSLAGDRYLNYFLNALAELPAVFLCIWMLQRFGRRGPFCLFHILVSVSLGCLVLIPETTENGTNLVPLIITMNIIGRFAITFTYNALLMFTLELFPTNARNTGLGVASFFGRVAACFAPFTTLLMRIYPWLPGVIFAVLSLIGGIVALFLTETVNRPLPEHAEEIKRWHRDQRFLPWMKPKETHHREAPDVDNITTLL